MSSHDPLIGQKLGDYVIQEMLGKGGMARVYKGYDERLDRYAAVKVIEPNLIASEDDEEYRERFLKEARAIARLNHPRVVGVFQFGQLENLYYMAMVFVEGRDLREIIKENLKAKRQLSHAQILRIVRDVAEALDYAHEQSVIHRDVKPSNIMVTVDGHAVLTDFGLALNAQEGTIGNTFGSVHYIAPEQAVSSAQSVPQSDLYSLGIVLYEMLTGRVPFEDVSAMSVALKHISDPPPPPSSIDPNIAPQIEDVIIKVLDKEPTRRYKSGRAFIHALDSAFAASDEETHDVDIANPLWDEPTPFTNQAPTTADPPVEEPVQAVENEPSIVMRSLDAVTRPGGDDTTTELPATIHGTGQRGDGGRGRRRTMMLWGGLILLFLVLAGGGLLVSGVLDGEEDDLAPIERTEDPATQVAAGQGQPTETDPPTATAEPTNQLETRAVTLAATETDMPTATDEPPSETPEESEESDGTSTADMPDATAAPTSTPAINATTEDDASLLLYYDWRQLVIYNRTVGNTRYDVRSLSFRDPASGESFDAADWEYRGARWNIRPQLDCFQILDASFVQLTTPTFCPILQAFERTREPFWNASAAGGTFEVLWEDEVITTCPIIRARSEAEVRCLVNFPE